MPTTFGDAFEFIHYYKYTASPVEEGWFAKQARADGGGAVMLSRMMTLVEHRHIYSEWSRQAGYVGT
jgi:hypothetical protein